MSGNTDKNSEKIELLFFFFILKQIHPKVQSRVILPSIAYVSIDSCCPGVGMTE